MKYGRQQQVLKEDKFHELVINDLCENRFRENMSHLNKSELPASIFELCASEFLCRTAMLMNQLASAINYAEKRWHYPSISL